MNKKGFCLVTLVPCVFKIGFLAIGVACIWHIPAWTKAKTEHKEAQYQASVQWPQQVFNSQR